ncbi:tetratricopeptide (TPR) repeat protein [Luteimonas cucumeris]|uniref:Tetratricopeptide (TPR) repeat protein n=2 Tax=Luteimonas cucumeris TaxID=985012 RepID=A0A562LFD8_9GAMM|nr:tetratricopeptide (TPR) repeat protein [Luteimonas cucumeris]
MGAERQLAHAIILDSSIPAVYYNHGNALSAIGRCTDAIASYNRAIALKPDMAAAFCNRGNAQSRLGLLDEAVISYRSAVSLRNDLVEAHNNLGSVLLALGRNEEALGSFNAVLDIKPSHVGALNNRGNSFLALDQPNKALASYDRALTIESGSAEINNNRGMALQALGLLDEAIVSHSRAIELMPGFVKAYCDRSNARRRMGRPDLAIEDCERAFALRPDSAEAFNARGISLHDMLMFERALDDYDYAIKLMPLFAEAHNNRGNVLHDLGRSDEALESMRTALALKPRYAEAMNNMGMIFQDTRRFKEALSAYDAALEFKSGYKEAYKRRATLKLLQGQFHEGWKDYAVSMDRGRGVAPSSGDVPFWSGESLRGKSILLYERNGYGDTIQFFRYAREIVALGAKVTFVGAPRLVHLLATCAPQVRFLDAADIADEFDCQCDLWSLPRIFSSDLQSIPAEVPYLAANPQEVEFWREWLGTGYFNIGISWQGNPQRKIDSGRSIPLSAFAPLARTPGVRLISLQRNFGLDQLDCLPEGMSVVDPGSTFDSGPDAFRDTAALMMGLDLVVTSDTATAHLAGALARPTWVALKSVPEWRWLLDRPDSPWYPTMRIFRQKSKGNWPEVFEAMATRLATRVA